MKKECFKCASELERTGKTGEWKCTNPDCNFVWVNVRVSNGVTTPVHSTYN